MEQKIYNLNEYRNIKAEQMEEFYGLQIEPKEQQPIHRIKLFGHRYRIKQEAYEIYQVIGDMLTMLFGIASIFMILFYMLLTAQR